MRSCLLVIDFINDIVHENGKIPSCAAYVKQYDVLEKTNAAIKLAHNCNMLTIFVKIAFSAEYYELPLTSPIFSGAAFKSALKLGEWGTMFHDDLDCKATDAVVIKPRVSAFYATPLEALLRAQKIDTIFITGVSTNNAVQATARDAHDRDYKVIIIDDACGAKDRQTHENTLLLLKDFSLMTVAENMLDHVEN